ncbi:hypothetical protein ES332_D07G250500v1 [Gossypium tomentosum]|uniref:Uncharacterized protein n=1 Tax=Gossypium tomentosum TaxID=34277 RepID=A0A5D2KAL0_GOSTO|nr:hypothetical protein ES332_D07G250500v1 [Gossypium tomentosum]
MSEKKEKKKTKPLSPFAASLPPLRRDYTVNGGRSCTPRGFLASPRVDPKAFRGMAVR